MSMDIYEELSSSEQVKIRNSKNYSVNLTVFNSDKRGQVMSKFNENEKPTTFLSKESSFNLKNSSSSFFNDFDSVVLNEKWVNNINIPSKIIDISKDFIICNCLVDKENLIFENRAFPKILFQHITEVQNNRFVLISMKSKAGSIKFDVYKGDTFFDKKLFEKEAFVTEEAWERLENNNFDDSFEYTKE